MIVKEAWSDSLKQNIEDDRDIEYALSPEVKIYYSPYIKTYKSNNLIESDSQAHITTMFGARLFQILWNKQENKDLIDSYITKQLKLRLDDSNHSSKKQRTSSAQTIIKKSYAQSIASKSPKNELATTDSKSSNKFSDTVKFIAVLHLLNGHILRLLPHSTAYNSNRATHLSQLNLDRGQIQKVMIGQNNSVFKSEKLGPQHISCDSLIPISYLDSSFIEQCSNGCFNIIIKGIGTAITKLFTRFADITKTKPFSFGSDNFNRGSNSTVISDSSSSKKGGSSSKKSSHIQQLVVSRVSIMMINALCRALDPTFNDETTCFTVFTRIITSKDFNTLCNKVLSLSKNIIPSEIKLDENDILPTLISENTAMLDMGYLEKYVEILQSYLWTNKQSQPKPTEKSSHSRKSSKTKSKKGKKNKDDDSKKETYSWPGGPQNCNESDSIKYIFKTYRGKMKAATCQFCKNKALGSSVSYPDIWKHIMIRHSNLLKKYTNLNEEFNKLQSALDGGDMGGGDDANVDPRFKNLNQEYVSNLAMMGFPIEWCQFALAECNNDIANASDWLLNHLDNIEDIMRQREQQRLNEKQKKMNDKKRKAAQFQMEYKIQYQKIKQFQKRNKENDYLDIFTPINIVKKTNNTNIYNTISSNNSYSVNDFGKKYRAKQSIRPFQLQHLLSRINDKYTFQQIQVLLARAQFYLATMYARKLIALLLHHSHSIRNLNLFPFNVEQLIKETKETPNFTRLSLVKIISFIFSFMIYNKLRE